ncbi:hypothetical protein [Bradyrhizobium sp.]|uniref:hypothetical protein n=1 Tax=Bradyrhizobium sp. TaxID=376 RepID=UPI0035241F4C
MMRSIERGAPTSRKTAASESIIDDASSRGIRKTRGAGRLARAADLTSPEIIDNQVNVGWRSGPAFEVRIDHAATCLDGLLVAEIVGGVENEPCHLRRGNV